MFYKLDWIKINQKKNKSLSTITFTKPYICSLIYIKHTIYRRTNALLFSHTHMSYCSNYNFSMFAHLFVCWFFFVEVWGNMRKNSIAIWESLMRFIQRTQPHHKSIKNVVLLTFSFVNFLFSPVCSNIFYTFWHNNFINFEQNQQKVKKKRNVKKRNGKLINNNNRNIKKKQQKNVFINLFVDQFVICYLV